MKRQIKTRNLLRRKSQAGMTLIETLIALFVLMIVAVAATWSRPPPIGITFVFGRFLPREAPAS
ncbi:MAG: prepilin-type N-terminal cleavage/methylation domain-containing protein [Acidobacteriia bacterium]|nr:prepilin-type N-terminal cleavage/methylation domain-containing protein [Terriglobia bacterium]